MFVGKNEALGPLHSPVWTPGANSPRSPRYGPFWGRFGGPQGPNGGPKIAFFKNGRDPVGSHGGGWGTPM